MNCIEITNNNLTNNHPSSFFHNTDYFNNRISRIKQKIDSLVSDLTVSSQSTFNKQLTVSTEFNNQIQNQKQQKTTAQKDSDRPNCYSLRNTQKFSMDKINNQQKQKIISIYNQLFQFDLICQKDQSNAITNTAQLKSFKQDLKILRGKIERIIPLEMRIQLQNNKKKGYKKSELKVEKTNLIQNQEQNKDKLIEQKIKQVNQQLSKRKMLKEQQKYYTDEQTKCHICSLKCQII